MIVKLKRIFDFLVPLFLLFCGLTMLMVLWIRIMGWIETIGLWLKKRFL